MNSRLNFLRTAPIDTSQPIIGLDQVCTKPGEVHFKVFRGALSLGNIVHFELAGCTGQAKIEWIGGLDNALSDPDLNQVRGAVFARGPGNVIYKAAPPRLTDGSFLSRNQSSNADDETVCQEESGDLGEDDHWDAVAIGDLDDLFTPPYSLE